MTCPDPFVGVRGTSTAERLKLRYNLRLDGRVVKITCARHVRRYPTGGTAGIGPVTERVSSYAVGTPLRCANVRTGGRWYQPSLRTGGEFKCPLRNQDHSPHPVPGKVPNAEHPRTGAAGR
ncbi:hypothetical protein GCM10027444_05760 [Actinopolyspora lacussalsi]